MRRQRRSFKLLSILFGFTLIAAACGDDDDDAPTATTAATGEETTTTAEPSAAGGSVVLAGEQIPSSLNTSHGEHNAFWTAVFMTQVWQGVQLFQPDGSYEFLADMAEVELTSEDPQVVTYTINDAATWSDGVPISSDDFLFTWEANNGALGPEVDPESGENLPLYNSAGTAGYEDQTCEAESDKVVVCTYTNKYADWYALFGTVLPVHAFEAEGGGDKVAGFNEGFLFPDGVDLANVPSSGPYTISEIDGETSMTLTRNEKYWGEPALLDSIVVRWVTDPTQNPAAMENGEIDVMFPQAQVDLITQTETIPGVEFTVDFGTFFEHLDFNFSNVHLAKLEVRQAIGKAIDRAEIVERLPGQMSDEAEVMNHHFFYPGSAAYVANGEAEYGAQDIDAAKALLEGAGYVLGSDGIYAHPTDGRLSVRFTWRDPNPRRESTYQLAQASLLEAGIEVTDFRQPDFTFLDTGDWDMVLFGWTSITTPSGHTDIFRTDGGSNSGNYSNTEVDALFEQADVELDADVRSDLLNQIDEILWEEVPVIPMFQVPEFLAWRDTISGVEQNGYGGFMFNAQSWALAQ